MSYPAAVDSFYLDKLLDHGGPVPAVRERGHGHAVEPASIWGILGDQVKSVLAEVLGLDLGQLGHKPLQAVRP